MNRIAIYMQALAGRRRREASVWRPLVAAPSFAFGRQPLREARAVAYVVAQHRRGRPITEILEDDKLDRYSPNHRRLLGSPLLVRALRTDTAASLRRTGAPAAPPDTASQANDRSLLAMVRALHE